MRLLTSAQAPVYISSSGAIDVSRRIFLNSVGYSPRLHASFTVQTTVARAASSSRHRSSLPQTHILKWRAHMVMLKFFGPCGNLVFAVNVNSGDWPAPGDFVAVPGVQQPGRVTDR